MSRLRHGIPRMSNEPAGGTRHLSFSADARSVFRFLETDFGFMVGDVTESRVQYCSSTTWVTVEQDRRSGAIGVDVGLYAFDAKGRSGFPLQVVLRALGVPAHGSLPILFAHTPEARWRVLLRLAGLMRQDAHAALVGDREVFLRVSDAAIRDTKHFYRPDPGDKRVRARIREARGKGDYVRVARLYGWINERNLSDEERQERDRLRQMFVLGDELNAGAQPTDLKDD